MFEVKVGFLDAGSYIHLRKSLGRNGGKGGLVRTGMDRNHVAPDPFVPEVQNIPTFLTRPEIQICRRNLLYKY